MPTMGHSGIVSFPLGSEYYFAATGHMQRHNHLGRKHDNSNGLNPNPTCSKHMLGWEIGDDVLQLLWAKKIKK